MTKAEAVMFVEECAGRKMTERELAKLDRICKGESCEPKQGRGFPKHSGYPVAPGTVFPKHSPYPVQGKDGNGS